MLRKEPVLIDEYVRPGLVKLQFWHILDHRPSLAASTAAECAGQQGQFWSMHDVLFANQDQLRSGSQDVLIQLAAGIGLDTERFARCLNDETLQRHVQKVNQEVKARGVRIRPTFDINGQRVQGSPSIEQWRMLLDAMIP